MSRATREIHRMSYMRGAGRTSSLNYIICVQSCAGLEKLTEGMQKKKMLAVRFRVQKYLGFDLLHHSEPFIWETYQNQR